MANENRSENKTSTGDDVGIIKNKNMRENMGKTIEKQNGQTKETNQKEKDELEPPDGGWGWVVVVAAGLSAMSTLCIFQQFGLLFGRRLESATAVSTIANTSMTITSLVGLFNGPLYRKFNYRQVALVGAFLCVIAIFLTIFAKALWAYIVVMALFFGVGFGWLACSNSLAVNSYFLKKRRLAASIQWTLTGLGPIIMPLIIHALNSTYGDTGTLYIFTGIAMHAIVCALLLQPVEWHYKKAIKDPEINEEPKDDHFKDERKMSFFGSKTSIYTYDGQNMVDSETLQSKSKGRSEYNLERKQSIGFKKEFLSDIKTTEELEPLKAEDNDKPKKQTFKEKLIESFDLDLLKDKIFINIVIGLTVTNFNESNFAMMTPYILKDFGFDMKSTTTIMSILGAIDVASRMLVPLVAKYIKWNNRMFLIFGMMLTAIGRTILAIDHQTITICFILAIIGVGKAFRTVFNALVVPTHVPLEKLPGASGLALIFTCFYSLLFGPFIGFMRDRFSSQVLLHALNITTFLVFLSWSIEMSYTRRKQKKESNNLNS